VDHAGAFLECGLKNEFAFLEHIVGFAGVDLVGLDAIANSV